MGSRNGSCSPGSHSITLPCLSCKTLSWQAFHPLSIFLRIEVKFYNTQEILKTDLPQVRCSDLPVELQAVLESRDPLTAAPTARRQSVGTSLVPDSIENGTNEGSALKISFNQGGVSQVGSVQTSIPQVSEGQTGSFEIGSAQISTSQNRFNQIRLKEIGSLQVGVFEDSFGNGSIFKVGANQDGILQFDSKHIRSAKDALLEISSIEPRSNAGSVGEVGSTQIRALQSSCPEISSTKISLTSGIEPQQFFSRDGFSFQSVPSIGAGFILTMNAVAGGVVLSEDRNLMSRFSQTFLVPGGAKFLQFTVQDTELSTSALVPPDAPTPPSPSLLVATLLAGQNQIGFRSTVGSNTSIGHDSFVEDHILHPGSLNIRPSQVAPSQVGSNHISIIKEGIDKLSIRKVGTAETGVAQSRAGQVSTSEIGRIQTNLGHSAASQESSTQIDSFHEGITKIGATQINPTQAGIGDTFIDFQGSPAKFLSPAA
jgi:hypothetical protein